MTFLRSTLFNFLFYCVWSPIICIGMAPCLLLPRGFTVWVATLYQDGPYYLAKYILGIDYELRGAEHRPQNGAYLVASKHQSAYETLILYQLFGDPTIVLKKELLGIPLFGWFLRNMHRWGAHAMVITVFFHMCRVFYTRLLRGPRQVNW